ncbi:unnamed protein product [Moneuplotes crassus]|uniref:Uncharacterized protein n=1 Tax=Euplotes crassus TaxID=5936 RepID=A0AAD1Y6H6_EUPCR|nr:unnamed protein product [Moneuplotes crassus]
MDEKQFKGSYSPENITKFISKSKGATFTSAGYKPKSSIKLNKKHGYYQANTAQLTDNSKIQTQSIVRMDGTFYKPLGGNTKFVRKMSSTLGTIKTPAKDRSITRTKSDNSSPGMVFNKLKSDSTILEAKMLKARSESANSNYARKKAKSRKKISKRGEEMMIIRDMNGHPTLGKSKNWDKISQSTSSSRNKIAGAMSALSQVKGKNTIVPDISAIRLENSQEIPNSFSTLDHLHMKRKRGDSAHKSDSEIGSKNPSKVKIERRAASKQQKLFHERVKDASNIYTQSSLNIANFLNCSMHPRMQKTKKKKKSDKIISKNAYRTAVSKNNCRSQSSQQMMRESKAALKDHESFTNMGISGANNKLAKAAKNLSEIRLKRAIERRKKPSEVQYKTNVLSRHCVRDHDKSGSSNRANSSFLEVTTTKRTSKLPTNANSMVKKNATRNSHNGDILVVERLLSDLRTKIEELDEKSSDSDGTINTPIEKSNPWEIKLDLLSKSLKEYRTEFPKFTNYISYIKDQYSLCMKEFIRYEQKRKELLRQNLSKLRSLLDAESLQKDKLAQKVTTLQSQVKILESDLEHERLHKNDYWVKKCVFSRFLSKVLHEKVETFEDKVKSQKLFINKQEAQIEKMKIDAEISKEKIKDGDRKLKEFIEKLDLEAYDLCSDDFKLLSARVSEKPKKVHPVPRINIQKVLEIKEKAEKEDESCEEEEEEGEEDSLLTENEKYLPTGSKLESCDSLTRKGSLLRRKEDVIDLLNKCYDKEESKRISESESYSPNQSSSDTSKISPPVPKIEDDEVKIEYRNSINLKPFTVPEKDD